MNKPDKFIVLKMTKKTEEPIYKVFASWYGGYLDGDSWKINSGIVDIEIDGEMINFIGYSGSIYQCHKKSYGTSSYSQGILNNIINKSKEIGYKIKVMPEDTDWKELFENKKRQNEMKLKIAKACHAVNNVLCKNHGLQIITWEDKSPENQKIVLESITKILEGYLTSPEEAHNNFVEMKMKNGWEYGNEYSTENKTNPRLRDYDELNDFERMKEEFFFAIASSFKKK